MIRLLSTATGTASSSNTTTDPTPVGDGGKSRLRIGLDWFQSQLLSADGMALPNFERRGQRRASQWNGSDTGIHRIRINLDKNTIQNIIGLAEYTDKEYQDTFFDANELKSIFEQAYETVEKLQVGEVDPKVCTRGLDKLYGERQEACRTIRSKSINAVMDLQEEQWNNEADDFEALAKVCREITKEAKRRAVSEARQDTRAAQSYLRDVDTSQWDDTTTPVETKSILKVRTNEKGLPTGQPLFPDIRNHNASFHDLRRSPFANLTTPIGRDTTRETRRVAPSPNTLKQRSKERLAKQPIGNTSQSRRQAIAESMAKASEAGGGKNANGMSAGSNHSQASFASEDDHPPQRSRVIRRSSSAGALAMKSNMFPQKRNSIRSVNNNEEEGKGKKTKDLERKRVPPNRSVSSGEANLSAMTPNAHRRRMGVPTPPKSEPPLGAETPTVKKRAPPKRSKSDVAAEFGQLTGPLLQQRRPFPSSLNDDGEEESKRRMGVPTPPKSELPSGAETPTVKKRAPPKRSKSDVAAGFAQLSSPLLQQRRPFPSSLNDDGKEESKSESKTRAPPQKSKSGIVAGAKISRFARPSPGSDINEPGSEVTENASKGALKKRSHSPSANNRKTHSSEEILCIDAISLDAKTTKKKHLPRRTASDMQRKEGSGTEEENNLAKVKIKPNTEISQKGLPSRRLSSEQSGVKATLSGGNDIPPESSRGVNGKTVQKKVPLTKSTSEHGQGTHPSDHERSTSETERTSKGKSAPKKTFSGRSVSDHHRKDVSSSDDEEIFSLDGSSKEEKVAKKKALPRRSISDLNGSKHLSLDDEDFSENPNSIKGTDVKPNTEISQKGLPSRRLSSEQGGIKATLSGGNDIPPESSRGVNGKTVQKKVPLTKSTSEHGPGKHPSDHERSTSETERTSKGKSAPKKTFSGRSVSDHHRKDVSSSDDEEIFSLDGSSKEEKVVKKKALPRRSISDLNGSKHLSLDDEGFSENPKSIKGTDVKKRMPPPRSASAAQAPSGKASNATRAPPRERPE